MNALMRSLPPTDYQLLLDQSEDVYLSRAQNLTSARARPDWAYFITDGMASKVTSLPSGHALELEPIGNEGLVGASYLMGPAADPSRCFMRVGGYAKRVGMAALMRMFESSQVLRKRVLMYMQYSEFTSGQLALCNSTHTLDQRFARWILMAAKRLTTDQIPITQGEAAELMNVHRPSMSIAAKKLKSLGMIGYSHGQLTIVSWDRLQAAACSCAQVCDGLRQALLRDLNKDAVGV